MAKTKSKATSARVHEMTPEEREALLQAYDCWLDNERRWLAWERSGGDSEKFDGLLNMVVFATHSAAGWQGHAPPASSRAEFVLSAVGCDWHRPRRTA